MSGEAVIEKLVVICHYYKVGPLPVTNGVKTPIISKVISPVTYNLYGRL